MRIHASLNAMSFTSFHHRVMSMPGTAVRGACRASPPPAPRWKGGSSMSTHTTAHVGSAVGGFERPYEHEATHTADRSARQAYGLLRFAFVVAPILAGADKFFHYLVDWDQYLSPFVSNLVGGRVHQFMMAAGVVE